MAPKPANLTSEQAAADRRYVLSELPEALRYLGKDTPEARSSSPCE
jgi:hypothetical protein